MILDYIMVFLGYWIVGISIIIVFSFIMYLVGRLFGAGFFKSKKQFFHDFLRRKENEEDL